MGIAFTTHDKEFAAFQLLRDLASTTLDGEDCDCCDALVDGGHVMENDDTWSTLTDVVLQAREILK